MSYITLLYKSIINLNTPLEIFSNQFHALNINKNAYKLLIEKIFLFLPLRFSLAFAYNKIIHTCHIASTERL
jgi:hypothetical protein